MLNKNHVMQGLFVALWLTLAGCSEESALKEAQEKELREHALKQKHETEALQAEMKASEKREGALAGFRPTVPKPNADSKKDPESAASDAESEQSDDPE